jgi:hypothetical protein
MAAPTSLETGRYNVVQSFFKWVLDNVSSLSPLPSPLLSPVTIPFGTQFDRRITVADLATGPILCVSDAGLFAPERMDLDDRIRHEAGTTYLGTKEQTLIEFVIWGSTEVRKDETARIRRIRDALIGAYRYSGRRDSAGAFIVPPLTIYNVGTGASLAAPTATANFIEKDRSSNWLTENWIDDPDHPELVGLRGLLRIWWIEFFNAP